MCDSSEKPENVRRAVDSSEKPESSGGTDYVTSLESGNTQRLEGMRAVHSTVQTCNRREHDDSRLKLPIASHQQRARAVRELDDLRTRLNCHQCPVAAHNQNRLTRVALIAPLAHRKHLFSINLNRPTNIQRLGNISKSHLKNFQKRFCQRE